MHDHGLEYWVLDVFSTERLMGNPLAVVLHPAGLPDRLKQTIAREMNLSETTFVERRSAVVEAANGVRVRIFTTEEELPFAGHPTLGTASLLRAIAPEVVHEETVRLALNVGTVPVKFSPQPGDKPWPVSGVMTQNKPEFGRVLDPARVASLTGLKVEDFDPALPIQIVSTGTAFAIVALRNAGALARLRVQQEEATTWLRSMGARWFYVLGPTSATEAGEPAWRARMQFNGGEDPATGSAAGCAISYLVGHRVAASGKTVHLRQGVEMGRPSDLYLSARLLNAPMNQTGNREPEVDEVHVGGSTILVANGRIFLP